MMVKMEFFIGLLMIIIIGSTFYQIFEQRRIRRTKKDQKKTKMNNYYN